MQLRLLFSKWTQIAALLLMGGAVAWAIKLGVIISTNGHVIDTGAAAFLMTTGMILLLVGSTGIGYRLAINHTFLIRALGVMLSPVLFFVTLILFGMVTSPLFKNSSVWYAQQEAPIGVAVIVYLVAGFILYRSSRQIAI